MRAGSNGLLLALACMACTGCCSGDTVPKHVLRDYAEALRAGRLRRAYEMMTTDYRARHSYETFVRQIQHRPEHVQRAVALLSRDAAPIEVRAEAPLGAGDTLELVYRHGRWRIASDPLDFYRQDSPREALRSFVRALEQRRYDVVLRLVPDRWADRLSVEKLRQSWEGPERAEMAQLFAALQRNLDAPIRDDGGGRAIMAYGERHAVRFLREDGLWKIEDPD